MPIRYCNPHNYVLAFEVLGANALRTESLFSITVLALHDGDGALVVRELKRR